MTHEELLAKIDRQAVYPTIIPPYETKTLVYHTPTIKFTAELQDALRAVVELHKTYNLVTGWGTHSEPRYQTTCSHCDVVYPCPTIQAIEKELK